ncbi:MAG: hypothetical protein IV086_00500, partial [Hyphomonadaceae bacterium]|nr:hypothetical protein [Hyphomonadaceae bacterium]
GGASFITTAPPAGDPGTAGLGVDETLSAAELAVRDEIEADWMALLAFDVTAPLVAEEYNEMRGSNFDSDDAAFKAALDLLTSGRSVRETAILRGKAEKSHDDEPLPDDRAA